MENRVCSENDEYTAMEDTQGIWDGGRKKYIHIRF